MNLLEPAHGLVHVAIHSSAKQVTLSSHVHGMRRAQLGVEMCHVEMQVVKVVVRVIDKAEHKAHSQNL